MREQIKRDIRSLRWIKKSGDTSLLAAHAVVWLRPATREVMSALALVTIVYLLSVYLVKHWFFARYS